MAKTEFLQIRVTPEDLARIRKAAEVDHLDTSTWARRTILHAVGEFEKQRTAQISRSTTGGR
jgi:hypothetical protein